MKVFWVRLGLHLLAGVDAVWLWARVRKSPAGTPAVTAGAGVQASRMVAASSFGAVVWPEFSTLAHGFWRAQELTLFREQRPSFAEPILDLGCGDSLFGQLADFPKNGFGVDYDAASLAAAKELRSPLKLLQGDAGQLPLADACVATCLSNSVLEHLPDLDRCFAEVWRVLQPGGQFIFSMTLGTFTSQLIFWTGRRDAGRWVQSFGHLQQPTENELLQKLERHGFAIQKRITYQSRWTTAWYRFLLSPGFQFVERHSRDAFRRRLRNLLMPKVNASLRATPAGEGACVFVVARKIAK